jgi:cytochrome c551/c552
MKTTLIALAALGSLAVAGTAAAATGAELINSKGCGTCHAADAKKMGPSIKDISTKNKADAVDKITGNLKDGKGHPKVAASDAEIKQMVTFMITGK